MTAPIAPVEQPLDLGERADEAVVVADLGHQAPLVGERGELADSAGSRQNGFSQKTWMPALERRAHHVGVQASTAWR